MDNLQIIIFTAGFLLFLNRVAVREESARNFRVRGHSCSNGETK